MRIMKITSISIKKKTARPFRKGCSFDIGRTNKWVRTIHIHAKLKMYRSDKFNIKTSSTYKELADSAKKIKNMTLK